MEMSVPAPWFTNLSNVDLCWFWNSGDALCFKLGVARMSQKSSWRSVWQLTPHVTSSEPTQSVWMLFKCFSGSRNSGAFHSCLKWAQWDPARSCPGWKQWQKKHLHVNVFSVDEQLEIFSPPQQFHAVLRSQKAPFVCSKIKFQLFWEQGSLLIIYCLRILLRTWHSYFVADTFSCWALIPVQEHDVCAFWQRKLLATGVLVRFPCSETPTDSIRPFMQHLVWNFFLLWKFCLNVPQRTSKWKWGAHAAIVTYLENM